MDSVQINQLRWVGGADVSYSAKEGILYGAAVVLSFPELSVVEAKWVRDRVRFPVFPAC